MNPEVTERGHFCPPGQPLAYPALLPHPVDLPHAGHHAGHVTTVMLCGMYSVRLRVNSVLLMHSPMLMSDHVLVHVLLGPYCLHVSVKETECTWNAVRVWFDGGWVRYPLGWIRLAGVTILGLIVRVYQGL